MADGIIISQITSASPKYQAVFELRDAMLRRPLGMWLKNDNLERDHIDTIMIAEYNGQVIACLMLQDRGEGVVQLRQMAVAADWQGKGIGRQLVIAAEQFSSAQGFTTMMMHARKVALGFYSSMWYIVSGDEFTEVGIPHYLMKKNIKHLL
jgi:predicted GNAT family N-acyltransferase